MRLADFIMRDMETILKEWEVFAAQLPAAQGMTRLALRDHAKQILTAIAKDLPRSQTKHAQAEKSKGRAFESASDPETAAETHAILRAQSGFDINQLAAEYRALRASVLRLWMDACRPAEPSLADVIRFNEGIDQAIAESINFFSSQVDYARNLLFAMLAHDLRNPLHAILLTASYLTGLDAGPEVSRAASLVKRGGDAIKTLLDDLVDFNRCMFGLGIALEVRDIDLETVFADELELLRGAHPDRRLDLKAEGDTRGRWDGSRLQQLLRNLVTNALTYGSPNAPVRVTIVGDATDVRIEVINNGPTIENSMLDQIFDPLNRGTATGKGHRRDGSLGLGLYIVREVARAHGGEADARSDDGETVFSVRLPRKNECVAS